MQNLLNIAYFQGRMEEIVRKDILSALKEAVSLLSEDEIDFIRLRRLSDHTVHDSSIFQDGFSLSVGVLIYSLSKIIERTKNVNVASVRKLMEEAIISFEKKKDDAGRKSLRQILSIIAQADEEYGRYVQQGIPQAAVKKASSLYRHGLSIMKTAELLGVSMWDLQSYLGATNIYEQDIDISSVRQRLTFARSLFQ